MSPTLEEHFSGLPAEALVREGLADLSAGQESVVSLLVQIGGPRLRDCGVPVPLLPDAENSDRRLYARLAATHGLEAHSQFNSLVRQLVSFERALERRVWAGRRAAVGAGAGG
jgi:hypothetical protein